MVRMYNFCGIEAIKDLVHKLNCVQLLIFAHMGKTCVFLPRHYTHSLHFSHMFPQCTQKQPKHATAVFPRIPTPLHPPTPSKWSAGERCSVWQQQQQQQQKLVAEIDYYITYYYYFYKQQLVVAEIDYITTTTTTTYCTSKPRQLMNIVKAEF